MAKSNRKGNIASIEKYWNPHQPYVHRSVQNYLARGIMFGTAKYNPTQSWQDSLDKASESIIQNALDRATGSITQPELDQLNIFISAIMQPLESGKDDVHKDIESALWADFKGEMNKILDKSTIDEKWTGATTATARTSEEVGPHYQQFLDLRDRIYQIQTSIGGAKKIKTETLKRYEDQIRQEAKSFYQILKQLASDPKEPLRELFTRLLNEVPADIQSDSALIDKMTLRQLWEWMKKGIGYPAAQGVQGGLFERVVEHSAKQLQNFAATQCNDEIRKIKGVELTGSKPVSNSSQRWSYQNGGFFVEDFVDSSYAKSDVVITYQEGEALGISVKNISATTSSWIHLVSEADAESVLGEKLMYHMMNVYVNHSGGSMKGIVAARKQVYIALKRAALSSAIGKGRAAGAIDAASLLLVNVIDSGQRSLIAVSLPLVINKLLQDVNTMTQATSLQIGGQSITSKAILFNQRTQDNAKTEEEKARKIAQRVGEVLQQARGMKLSYAIALSYLQSQNGKIINKT